MEYPKFKVCCRCFTFNHAKFITDTMNGFTMQQTSFPFVCTVVDDASTDGEQEVIRKYVNANCDRSEKGVSYTKETDYAHILYAQHKTNKNCYFAVLLLKENHYSQKKSKMPYLSEWRDMCEYEALCEGDDYWVDSKKLQKQINILDCNKNAVLVHSAYKCAYEDGSVKSDDERISGIQQNLYNYMIGKFHIATLTSCFRLSIYRNATILWKPTYKMADLPLWLALIDKGDIIYLNDETSVYRVLSNSASHSTKKGIRELFMINALEIKIDYARQYGLYSAQLKLLLQLAKYKLKYYIAKILS